MGQLKNNLLNKLETDPVFADHYWQAQDRDYQEPVLPDEDNWNLSQTTLTLTIPTHRNNGLSLDAPPF